MASLTGMAHPGQHWDHGHSVSSVAVSIAYLAVMLLEH